MQKTRLDQLSQHSGHERKQILTQTRTLDLLDPGSTSPVHVLAGAVRLVLAAMIHQPIHEAHAVLTAIARKVLSRCPSLHAVVKILLRKSQFAALNKHMGQAHGIR